MRVVLSALFLVLLTSLAGAQITYQTGFNQTNDISGQNYTLGQIDAQNGWITTRPDLRGMGFEASEIKNDSIAHWGDGYMMVQGWSDIGIVHDANINQNLPADGCIKISMDIAAGDVASNPTKLAIKSSSFGTLLRWDKYFGASAAYSCVRDANGAADSGVYTGNIWAGWYGPIVSNCRFPRIADGHVDGTTKYVTRLEMFITSTQISYHSTDYYDDTPYGSSATRVLTFSSPLGDIRDFGNIEFIGLTTGNAMPLYVDNLKIEYLPLPQQGSVVTYQTGFDQTNDISGQNYAAGAVAGNNGWVTMTPSNPTYQNSTIANDSIAHWNDGYLNFQGVSGGGVAHSANMFDTLVLQAGGAVKLSMDIALGTPANNPAKFEIYSSQFGPLFRWDKYYGGSAAYSLVRDAGGHSETGTTITPHVWAGDWDPVVNDSIFPRFADGTIGTGGVKDVTNLVMTLYSDHIDYSTNDYFVTTFLGHTYSQAVTHMYTFPTSIGDVRNFGDIQFIATHTGSLMPAYIDNLKIEYVIVAYCGDAQTVYSPADINKDCHVDFRDFSAMAADWFKCTDPGNSGCNQYWQ